jgi:DNA-binding NarL/FixJ family response regulator
MELEKSENKEYHLKTHKSKMKIVIADDSIMFRERIVGLLKGIDNVEIAGEADNGLEILQIIKEKKPDLAILDIRMPEMNGIEVLRKIREDGTKIRICILTSYPYRQYRDRSAMEGADYFFDKNLDIKLITDLITTLANKQKGE